MVQCGAVVSRVMKLGSVKGKEYLRQLRDNELRKQELGR